MEPYRDALFRYSTGQGFNVNVNTPAEADDVASFKMEPLYTKLSQPGMSVDIKREADRVSMQVEAAMQQMKTLGYNAKAGKKLGILKSRVELIKHLMTTYPIRYVKKADLDRLYGLYEKNSPGMDGIISKIVNQNSGSGGVEEFIGTAQKVRKGYPVYDKFGRKLSSADKAKFKAKTLSGFGGDTEGPSLIKLVGVSLVALALYKWLTANRE
jgi:hypothetical protein